MSSARKCSHCKTTGHMMWDCDGVHMLWDRLYMEMEIMLEENLLGYRFEYFIESLTVPYLKIVYKMLCKKTMKKKEVYVYDEIYAAFQVLHPEYLGKPLRQTRLYGRVYSSVGTAPSNQKGSSLQSYIHSLSSYELDELVKLCKTNEVNWIGRQTYNREIHYLCESPHYPPRFLREIMNQKEMRIHCHFSEMGLGYHFTVLGYYNQNTPRSIEAFINKNNLLMHKLVHGIPRYSKTILLEETSLSEEEEEVTTDCVVCMDSKSNK